MHTGIGSALIMLFFALIILGFVLSDTIDTHQELNAAREENKTLKAQKIELEQQNLVWQEQVRQLEEQNRILEKQNNALEQRRKELDEENTDLKEQTCAAQTGNPIISKLPQKITNPLGPVLFIPILPIAVAATYAATRHRSKNAAQKNQGTYVNNMERGTMVRLSDDELKEVIKMRRGQ